MKLDVAREVIDVIDSINSGGCGIAALAIKQVAEKEGKSFYGFAFLYKIKSELSDNRRAIMRGYDPEAPYHVVVCVDGVWMDTARVYSEQELIEKFYVDFDIKEIDLLRCLENIDTWNPSFDRSTSVPLIEEQLNIRLDVILE